MTPATQNKRQLSLVAHTHTARSTTWALCLRLSVNTTQLNYFSLQRTTNPHPPLLYPATIIPVHQQICMYFHATI